MKENYGVDWFTCRGEHYSKIEDSMMEKYGVKNNFQIISNKHSGRVSNLEKQVVDFIIENYYKNNFRLVNTFHNKQFTVKNDKSWYALDFYDKVNNIVIDVHGDLWHCNPKFYKEDYFHTVYNLSAKEIWQKDRLREENIIKELNCTYFIIWEYDWKHNKKEVINSLNKLLNDKNK